MIWETK